MAEDLDDGEFWLPSEFLTDHDLLNHFSTSLPSLSASASISGLTSIDTDSSDDDDHLLLLSGLPRQFSNSSLHCPIHSKGWVLSSSPQSTLCGCDCNHQGSTSSLGSPNGPVSPPKVEPKDDSSNKGDDNNTEDEDDSKDIKKNNNNATLDLLNKAAGEVAKMKMRSESGRSTVGTGFFDCSNSAKGLLCPPPPPPPTHQLPTNPTHFPPFYSHPHFRHYAPMMWGPLQFPPPQLQPQQNKVTKTTSPNTKSGNGTNARPLGLPPSAWPPLPGQPQPQPQSQAQPQAQTQPQTQPIPMMGMYAGQPGQKGTGVFLPRRVATTPEPKKKSEGKGTKTKSSKGSQRRNSRTPKAIEDEIQLPPEWVY